MIVAPSLLAADYGRLAEDVAAVEAAGADWLHLDVMDGHFVPNISFGPAVIKALRPHTRLYFDVHLMIAPVEPLLAAFVDAGANGITVHVEAVTHLDRALAAIADAGLKAGVALNPATPAAALRPVLHRIDVINVMTVNPGFGGQSYLPNASQKLREAKALAAEAGPGRTILVEADGGIAAATAAEAKAAGADVLIAGSAIFGAPDHAAAIAALRNA